jgi:serine/threonine-protein kinase
MTQAGMVLGTAAYMAPEQAKGKFLDRRADIWAFGAVLFEMLTATRTFGGEDVTDTIAALITKEPAWSLLPADTPVPVRSLLRRCLEKDARRRLRDIGEARILIGDVLAGHVEAGTVVTTAAAAPPPLWRRIMPLAATAVMIGLAGFAGGLRYRPEPQAPAIAHLAIPLEGQWQFGGTASRMLAMSPDGSRVAYIGQRQLYVRPLADSQGRPVPGTEGSDPTDPFFSPDGQWLGFYSIEDGTLRKIPVSGGRAVTVAKLEIGVSRFQGGEWDGNDILFARVGEGIMRVSADGGAPELIVPVAFPASAFGPQRLPGGSIMFAQANQVTADRWDTAEIVVYSPSSGQRKTVLRGGGAPRYVPSGHLIYAVAGNVMAVPFDVNRLEITGGPVQMMEDVRRSGDITSGAAQFAVSAAGHVAYIPGQARQDRTRWWITLQDRQEKTPAVDLVQGAYLHPRVSPDGKQFTVFSDVLNGQPEAVWVGALKVGAGLRRLTLDGNSRFPVWSADSRFVFYVSDRAGELALYRQLADGSGTAERLVESPELLGAQSAHPDGKTLIVWLRKGSGDLWTWSADGGLKPLVERPAVQIGAAFAPNGRWVAYGSNEGGGGIYQVFVEPFPPTGARYQVTTTGGTFPMWSPDGGELFYAGPASSPALSRLMVIRVRAADAFGFDPPVPVATRNRSLTPFRDFDMTPDGKLLWIRRDGNSAGAIGESAQINVVLNFFEDLKQRVPATTH